MITYLLLSSAIVIAAGLLFSGYRQLAKKSYFYGAASLVFSLPIIAIVALTTSLIIDGSTIKRLTKEHTIATIEFQNVGPLHFRASFTEAHQPPVEYDLYGDQWQVDARILKWGGFAAEVGLKPMYQFERISGRYQDVQLEMKSKRSIYALENHRTNDNKAGSIWGYLLTYQEYIPWLDSQYGSATYMPMQHGAVFTIKLSQNGLLARPRNFIASQSVKQWL